ncbi:MAG: glucuronyl esterase domain-containing protein [Promethearchaeota archaeon]
MKLSKRKLIAIVIISVFTVSILSGGVWFLVRQKYPKIIKSLPDPFILNNGTRVSTQQEWEIRRTEIKQLLQSLEFGTIPDRPDGILATETHSEVLENGTKKTVVLSINSTDSVVFNMTIWVYTPDTGGPHPVVIKVSPDGTGTQEPISEIILDRGYMYVCYDHVALDEDTKGYDTIGPAQAAYSNYSWGSLGVWAWGASRVLDYLIGESWVDAPSGIPDADPSKLIITGHSRRGKTALLAGAMDERFAMVVPNGSGCGGTGSFLVQGSVCETIQYITSEKYYKSWFKEDFNQFSRREQDLPFDQHFLCALVAPRVLISTNALQDYWANPSGTQTIYKATRIVYNFLGVKEKLGNHYRKGTHAFKEEDFGVLLDFADLHLMGKNITGDFYMTPYRYESPIEFIVP